MLVSKMKIIGGRVKMKDAEWDNMNYAGEIHGCKVFRDDKDRYHVYRNGKSILSYQYGSWSQLERDVAKKVGANDSKTKDKHSKTRDRNLTEINQERRNLENAYAQALRDGDKSLARGYSNRLEELRKEAIKAEEKRDEERKNFGDTKDEDDIFKKRQIEIAKKTLRMPDAMVNIIGGMTKAEAREILKKYGVSEDSKTKDEKIISIATPQWEGDIKIIDGTHFEMKAKGTDRWSWALHIGQADDHILNALKAKGVLKDNGRFFATDSKTKDSFYDVFAKRDGRGQKFNNKPLILEEANELVEHINKAGMPSVEKGSAERVIIMGSKTKDVVLVNGYEIRPSPESRTWVVMKDGDVIKRFNDYESAYRFAKGDSVKDGKRPPDEAIKKYAPQAPSYLRNHPMWSPVDYAYFRYKGIPDEQIKAYWDRDHRLGNKPATWGDSKDAYEATKPKNIAAAKNLSKAQGQAASDGGPGSGKKGHTSHNLPDPSTHQERRKERANLQKYFENAMRSGNIKEAQKHSQRLAHINSLQLKG